MQTEKTLKNNSSFFPAVSDIKVMLGRSLKHIFKNLDQLMSLAIQPIMFMLLFRYVFGGAINTGGVTYVNFLVAGILIQMTAFGATTTSISVATDVKRGIIDRFKSLPIMSSAVMIGHVSADLVRNTISSIVMIGVAFLVGFRPEANFLEWLIIWGIVMLFTFAFSWFSAIMGLLAKSVEAVQWMGFLFVFPLTFASSAFVSDRWHAKISSYFCRESTCHSCDRSGSRSHGGHSCWRSYFLVSDLVCGSYCGVYSSRRISFSKQSESVKKF
jgi:ABC-2 type transport system permease protein